MFLLQLSSLDSLKRQECTDARFTGDRPMGVSKSNKSGSPATNDTENYSKVVILIIIIIIIMDTSEAVTHPGQVAAHTKVHLI